MNPQTIIEIYEDVLKGNRNRFPRETWKPHNGGFENFRRCLRYLVLDKLKLDREQMLSIGISFFIEWKLRTPFQRLYDSQTYKCLSEIFSEMDIKPWEMKISPDGVWNDENMKGAIRWVVSKSIGIDRDKIIKNIGYETFKDFYVSTLIHKKVQFNV
ncbi:DUF4046 domain-containing protein [Paenibacillus harenae]|uniref:DUF4046 domain-containing protein n=1 Tax=Paenibacillus harenae TaxID=306543 RepID=UPI002791B801|nr:DUF4046 domain-containing protein [Paenibacillus harenae]MDQ0060754.1 hypothetical protein [Paenibacillus harenae]